MGQTLTVLKNGPNKSVKFYTNKSGRDFYLTNDGKVQMYDGASWMSSSPVADCLKFYKDMGFSIMAEQLEKALKSI